MKKLISLVLVCLFALSAFGAAFAEEATFEGKIGILYTNVATNEEEYRAALNVQEKYGEDKVLIMSQPANKDTDTFISLAQGFAADPEMKAIIICQASSGSIAVCKAIREMRDDILIVCGGMTEELDQISGVMDIGFQKAAIGQADQIVNEAIAMGATYLVHYAYPSGMSGQVTFDKYEEMERLCAEKGIGFELVYTPDPYNDAGGIPAAQQFIIEDVRSKVNEHGKDTAFYGTAFVYQEPLIKTVAEEGAIFTQQSDPSPFNGFPSALGIEIPEDKTGDTEYMLNAITEKVAELGMTGRMGTWSFALFPMFVEAGAEYAIAYMNGETDGKVDYDVLKEKFDEYAQANITLEAYANKSGETFDNVIYVLGEYYKF